MCLARVAAGTTPHRIRRRPKPPTDLLTTAQAAGELDADIDPEREAHRLKDFEHGLGVGFESVQVDSCWLLMWEALHYSESGGQPPHSEERRQVYRRKVDALASGGSVDAAKAALTLFVMTGLAAWPLAMHPLGRLIAGDQFDDESSMTVLRELVGAMAASLTRQQLDPR